MKLVEARGHLSHPGAEREFAEEAVAVDVRRAPRRLRRSEVGVEDALDAVVEVVPGQPLEPTAVRHGAEHLDGLGHALAGTFRPEEENENTLTLFADTEQMSSATSVYMGNSRAVMEDKTPSKALGASTLS